MKLKLFMLAFLGFAATASASFVMTTQFGTVTYEGNPVPDGTLWALVVDANDNNSFFGGFGLNDALDIVGATSSGILGSNIALGSNLGGDIVFALGGFNGFTNYESVGLTSDFLEFTHGINGLAVGLDFAFYYFPGVFYTTQEATYGINGAAGGLNVSTDDSTAGLNAMIIPADGASVTVGAASSNLGGTILPDSAFAAVPEPSAALLGALGALFLLRRRRN